MKKDRNMIGVTYIRIMNREYTMNKYRLWGRILSALLVNPLLLLVIKHKKYWTFFWCVLVIPWMIFGLLFLHNWHYSEGGIRKIYYFDTYKANEVRVVEDNNFLFYEDGYSKEYTLNSKYYIAHRILLIPDSKSVPVDYKFDGRIHVEMFDKEMQLLHSFDVDKPVNLLREGTEDYFVDYLVYNGYNSSHVTSVFAFELGSIPFDLFRSHKERLKNMKIRVTILRPEMKLLEHCDKVTLVIIPDLQLI